MFLLVLQLLACTTCVSVDEVPIELEDAEAASIVREALRDFDRWTGSNACLTRVEAGERGASGRVVRAESRADVFYARCLQMDRATGIAASAPEVFTGTGIDSTQYRTVAARATEDFARACARVTDQRPWLEVAAGACSESSSEAQLGAEDAFMLQVFGGPESALPRPDVEEAFLGAVPAGRAFQMAPLDDLLVTVDYLREDSDMAGGTYLWSVAAYDLPSLDALWIENLPPASVVDVDLFLFAGTDRALVTNGEQEGPYAGSTWIADREGLVEVAPIRLDGLVFWWSGAVDGDEWLLHLRADDGMRSVVYDPFAGVGPKQPWPEDLVVRSAADGPVLLGPDAVVQPSTGRQMVFPGWLERTPRWSAERVRVDHRVGRARQVLSKSFGETLWTLDSQTCESTGRAPADGVGYDYSWNIRYDSDDGSGRDQAEIWRRR